jgi:DNA-binding CsgD family transcriptional regulator
LYPFLCYRHNARWAVGSRRIGEEDGGDSSSEADQRSKSLAFPGFGEWMSRKQHSSKGDLNKLQLQLVKLVAQGRSNREIAQIIGTTEQVVQDHLHDIQDKLGLSHRLELILWHTAQQDENRG